MELEQAYAPPVAFPVSRVSARRLLLLTAMYIAQGIPFGFATIYIPLQLAQRTDFKYGMATWFNLASFPWLLKMLWAPSADTRYWKSIGRRRSWILPAQLLLSLTALAAMKLDFVGSLTPVFAVVVLFNLWASVQDTAVDGLAVEILTETERGLGNAAQVGGYKIGMIAGGSGLVVVAEHYGTSGAMIALAGGVGCLLLAPLFYREGPPPPHVAQVEGSTREAIVRLVRHLREGGWLATLLFISTVKIGETMVSSLLKPFLVREVKYSVDRASFILGVVGLTVSLVGSVLGGYVSGIIGRLRALVVFGISQAVVLSALGIAVKLGQNDFLAPLVVVEHFAAGLLTPALFAYMMDITQPAIAATHYTVLSTVELVAKGTGGAVSGPLADHFGVAWIMLMAGTIGALPLLLLPALRRPRVAV